MWSLSSSPALAPKSLKAVSKFPVYFPNPTTCFNHFRSRNLCIKGLIDGLTDSIGAVESVKAASDIYAPISGAIEEINETLSDSPGLLNKSPQKDGAYLILLSLMPLQGRDPAELAPWISS